jgi:hypothetical protein
MAKELDQHVGGELAAIGEARDTDGDRRWRLLSAGAELLPEGRLPVPDDIDDALLGLGRQAGLSSVLRSLEAALDLAVSSAFQRSPPYPTDVTKTLDLLRAWASRSYDSSSSAVSCRRRGLALAE